MSGAGGIEDGELAYLKPTRDSRKANGHVVVCTVGDAAFLKKLAIRGRTVRLLSLNQEYEAIDIDRPEDFRVIGIVIGQRKVR
jgi:SOS-response transcriptional repressor LexA